MKNIIKILALVLLFGASSVSMAHADFSCRVAASCSGSEVSVLEMAKATNSHAGLPGSGYPFSVCCSGATGLGNVCSGSNTNIVIAKLSGSSNAHVRASTQADYPSGANACISATRGNLEVSYQNDCSSFGTAIASMAKFPTNSHVGGPNDYPNKICVKYTAPPSSGFGFLGGGGGGGVSPVPVTAVNTAVPVTNQVSQANTQTPSFLSRVRSFFGGNSQEAAPVNDIQAEIVNVGDNNTQDSSVITPNGNTNNVLAAAAGTSNSGFLNSPFVKIFSWILLLILVIIGRKIYLSNKRKNNS